MRRFILTSDKLTGTFEIWYGLNGLLCYINLVQCNVDYRQIQWILQNISPDVSQFRALLPVGLKATEQPFNITLDDFKREYPYSRNYHLLNDYWPKISLADQVAAYFGAMAYRGYSERNKSWYIPRIAIAWLRSKEYLNDWNKM